MDRTLCVLVSCVIICSAQLPDLPPLQCVDLDPSDGIDHLRCYSGQILDTTLVRTVNDTLENLLAANEARWDPRVAISISNLGGSALKNFDSFMETGQIDDNGNDLYPDIRVEVGETVLLLFHKDSNGRDAAKGLAAFDIDDTFVKVVVAFDVDGNRQEASVLKYNVELRSEYDGLGQRMWADMINDGFDAMVEDASEFTEIVESGVVMQASMSDTTENTYMVRIDSTNFS